MVNTIAYNKFPNLGVYHTTFYPICKALGALPKIAKKGGSILLGNPIFLLEAIFFRGIRTPCPPYGSAHGTHLKEGTCLKCSFQRVVIIGPKVGLDYNSWYACLLLIRHIGRSSGSKLFATLIAGRKSRDCTVFAHESFVLAWCLKILKHNVWVSQSILLQLLLMRERERGRDRDWYIKVNIPSADRLVERDVCMCLFEFRQVFYSGNSSMYFKVCVDLCKKI